jgi:hypothetical protein
MDVSSAYLTAPLRPETQMYICPPPGIRTRYRYGLRLRKALYGTKQGGNRWAAHRGLKLAQLNLSRSDAEPCLYFRLSAEGYILVAVIVDDFAITGSSDAAILRFKAELSATWKMTDLGELKWTLNIDVKQHRSAGVLTISQSNYVSDILERYGLDKAHGVATPAVPGNNLEKVSIPEADRPTTDDYANMTGALQHVRLTRPNTCSALSAVCQHNQAGAHIVPHFNALKRIFRYLAARPSLCKHQPPSRKPVGALDVGGF